MNTFLHFLPNLKSIPMITTWELATLAEMKGHQELYTRQSPQRLKKMLEFSMIESAVSSNRIEGVFIEDWQVDRVELKKQSKKLFTAFAEIGIEV